MLGIPKSAYSLHRGMRAQRASTGRAPVRGQDRFPYSQHSEFSLRVSLRSIVRLRKAPRRHVGQVGESSSTTRRLLRFGVESSFKFAEIRGGQRQQVGVVLAGPREGPTGTPPPAPKEPSH